MEELSSRRVLIVEGNADGHRLSYVALLASAAIAAGDEIVFATRESVLSSREFPVHMSAFGPELELRTMEDFSVRGVERLCREHNIDHAVIPDGDSFAYQLSKGQSWAWRGTVTALVMREKGQPSRFPGAVFAKTFVKGLLLLAANRQRRVEVRVLKSATWRGFSLLPTSRDPVVLSSGDETLQRNSLPSLSDGLFWFGVIGKIGHRKNLPLVAASLAALQRSDIGLLVAGQVEDGVLLQAEEHFAGMRQAGGQVVILDRLLGDSELDALIRELDCVVLAHSNEGPSGILGKAVAAGTRIVAAGAGSLRKDCRHIGNGAEWSPLARQQLSTALGRSIGASRPIGSPLASPYDFAAGLLRLE